MGFERRGGRTESQFTRRNAAEQHALLEGSSALFRAQHDRQSLERLAKGIIVTGQGSGIVVRYRKRRAQTRSLRLLRWGPFVLD
jgi:hypothetical protein